MSTTLDVPISTLPVAAALAGNEQLPMVQGGQTVRSALGAVAAHVIASLPTAPDLTPPPDVTNLTVNAAISHIIVTFDAPTYTVGHGNGRTDIYAVQRSPTSTAPEPTFSTAVLVGSALDSSPILAVPSNPDVEWHVWAKYVSVDGVASPDAAGGANGVVATTGQDVSALLNALTGQITSSQLFSTLGAQINLISAPSSTAGSVASQVKAETDARVSALTAEAGYRSSGDATTLATAQTYVQTWSYSKSATDSAIAAEGSTLTTAFSSADSSVLASANTYTSNYSYSKSAVDSALAAQSSTLTTNFTSADAATLASANAYTYSQSAINSAIAGSATSLTTAFQAADANVLASAQSFTYSRSAIDGAIATSSSTLTAAYGSAISSAVSSEATSRANADTALSNTVSTLSSTVNGNTAALSTEATTRATADGALFAQYTVKLDTNGYVSGFGLASTSTSAAPYSQFIVRADSFSIASPSGPGINPIVPFVVQTTSTTINGQTVPPGVYMNAAYIMNGTITTAMIGLAEIDDALIANLSAAKLTAGSIAVGSFIQSAGFVSGSTGWQINGNGVAEFSGVIVRGTIYASAGSIGGAEIDSAGVQSTNYSAGSAGWRFDDSAGVVYAASLHVQDSTGTRIINTDATGTAYVLQIGSNFWVKATGDAYFGGVLEAGIVDTSQIVGGAVTNTVSVSATSGLISGGSKSVCAGTISTIGGNVLIVCDVNLQTAGSPASVGISVLFDGSVVYTSSATGSTSFYPSWAGTRTPGSGSHSFSITCTSSSTQTTVYSAHITCIELKR